MRIKISKRNSELIDGLTKLYNFRFESIISRIAFAYSLQLNKRFDMHGEAQIASDGKDWRDERAIFGVSNTDRSNYIIFKVLLDQHYGTNLSEDAFIRLFKMHLDFGLEKIHGDISDKNIASGYHISHLMKIVKSGLDLVAGSNPFVRNARETHDTVAYDGLVTLTLGKDEEGNDVIFRINDLNEFDSCNIAIAGMTGSGKTEMVKDILYQVSLQSKNQVKFIYFDYKGDGVSDNLKPFFELTACKMVDLKKEALELNPLSTINLYDEREKAFNIRSFVEFICTIATQLDVDQKHILQTVISECFELKSVVQSIMPDNYINSHPTLTTIREQLDNYYESNYLNHDSLYSLITDLSTGIFSGENARDGLKIYEQSLYINLPFDFSEILRQLCVFLTLKYLLAGFNSMNDTAPTDEKIKPLRYIIVIDEAHVYLRTKSASKALEDILRVLRSKGVIVIMLTQGVEDFKTRNFDFASQIKIPICLNINNKDYRLIESFVGTPRSRQKLQEVIAKLEVQKAIINIMEPQIIKFRQFWKTIEEMKI